MRGIEARRAAKGRPPARRFGLALRNALIFRGFGQHKELSLEIRIATPRPDAARLVLLFRQAHPIEAAIIYALFDAASPCPCLFSIA